MSEKPVEPTARPSFILPASVRWATVGFVLFALMLAGSRERPWADATPVFEVAESLVQDGDVTIRTPWPEELPTGRHGKIYAAAPILQSLMHVPGAAVRSVIGRIWDNVRDETIPFAAHIGPGVLSGLCCVLFLLLCADLGIARKTAFAATGLLLFGSTLWVYGRSPYSEIFHAVLFTWMFGRLLLLAKAPTKTNAIWFGVTVGLLINIKMLYAVCLPGAAVFALLHWRGIAFANKEPLAWSSVLRLVGWAVAACLPFLALILVYNKVRWDGFLRSGYDLEVPVFTERMALGIWGMFLSPGKSAFLYSPPLLLSLIGLPLAWRRNRSEMIAILLTVTPVLLVYGRFLFWSGDYAWGPRYLVFAVPVFMIPGALLLDAWRLQLSGFALRFRLSFVVSLLAAGMFVQMLGSALYWDHFIRIAIEARANWLGWPNKSGAPTDSQYGTCGACFEDVHPVQWLPPFQPIEGHLWLVRHVLAHDDVETAERDAPWHRYTRVKTPISLTYPRARLDWWFMAFREDKRVTEGVLLLVFFSLGTIGFAAYLKSSKCFRAPPLG
ncbi:MAG: hypothetical protein SGI86_05900 [Deltaproteobacteria bacterium]|nr:hypothetical protein [Deltaproteobacteria bacterium]